MENSSVSQVTPATSSPPTPLLPPKPEEPLDSECCGTGCTPCVFDIYKEKLRRWEEECEEIVNGRLPSGDSKNDREELIITPYEYFKYEVKEIIEDCLHCKILGFKKLQDGDNSQFERTFKAASFPVNQGQHVVLKIKERSRQYTVLNFMKDGSFSIIFKIYESGYLTPFVDEIKIGDVVQMRGPFGKEFIHDRNIFHNLVMFAAGTGIAPFCRIIDSILENDSDETRISLLFACRNENEIMLLNKLKEWSRSWNFHIQYFLSHCVDPKVAQSKHFGAQFNFNRVDKTVILKLVQSLNYKDKNLYLVCGTKSYEKDIVNYLKQAGVSEDQIKAF